MPFFRTRGPESGGWVVRKDEVSGLVEFARTVSALAKTQRSTTLRIEVIAVREPKPPRPQAERATRLREELAAEGRRRAKQMRMRTGPMVHAETVIGSWRLYTLSYSMHSISRRATAREETTSYLLFSPDYATTRRVYHFRARQWYAQSSSRRPDELRDMLPIIASFDPSGSVASAPR